MSQFGPGGDKAAPEYNPIIKLKKNPTSLRKSINAFCAQCMGCTEAAVEPGFRNEIRDCTAKHCALWNVRPHQEKD